MIQFSKPRKAYNPDERFLNGQAHAVDAREMFARPPLASAGNFLLSAFYIVVCIFTIFEWMLIFTLCCLQYPSSQDEQPVHP